MCSSDLPAVVEAGEGGPSAGERQWPSAGAAYWALLVIVLATFITFFDAVTFGMLAERIKHDFGLTDSQLGFLAGPVLLLWWLVRAVRRRAPAAGKAWRRRLAVVGGGIAAWAVIYLASVFYYARF